VININLIRDRVQTPPTFMERLSPAFPVLLLIVYGITFLLFSLYSTIGSFAIKDLEQEFKHERKLLADVGAYEVSYTASDLRRIETVRRIVELYSNKWHWGLKLAALQDALPAGVAISSFSGQTELSVRIGAYAVNSDGKGLERITAFARKLRENELFMQGLAEVSIKRVFNPVRGGRPGMVEFELQCVVSS